MLGNSDLYDNIDEFYLQKIEENQIYGFAGLFF